MPDHRATFVKKTCDKVLRSPNPPGGWGGVPQILAKLGNFGFLNVGKSGFLSVSYKGDS